MPEWLIYTTYILQSLAFDIAWDEEYTSKRVKASTHHDPRDNDKEKAHIVGSIGRLLKH